MTVVTFGFHCNVWYLWLGISDACTQGRNGVRRRLGQEASLAPPYSNLSSFGSKCTVLKVLVALLNFRGPGNC